MSDAITRNQAAQILTIKMQRGNREPTTADPSQDRPLQRSGLAPGQFKLWRSGYTFEEDPWAVWCLLTTRPKLVRGLGGHGQLAREGRRAIAAFGGSETPAFSIGVRLDRSRPVWMSVSDQERNLERLAGFNSADDAPPPDVRWLANVNHDDTGSPGTRWAVETFEWGDDNSSDRGTLLWRTATFTIGLQREGQLPQLGRAKGFKTVTLPKGKTLRWFARQNLGSATRWVDVAALNRDNARCPSTADYPVKKPVDLLVPPREPK